jgi:hypothetical protein
MTLDSQVLVVAFLAISLRLVAMSFGLEGVKISRSAPSPETRQP